MRTLIIIIGLFLCFILPLQGFIIGDNNGVGIQTAIFRWQVTDQGTSLIPITKEITYVTRGIYSGKTAFMVFFWVLGTLTLTMITIFSLIYWDQLPGKKLLFIQTGLILAGLLFLASCITQYGILFQGPAGRSLPLGVLVLFIFSGFLYCYQDFICPEESQDQQTESD